MISFTVLILAIVSAAVSASTFVSQVDDLFVDFKRTYGRKYADSKEESYRKAIFLESMARVDRKNELNGSPAFGVTKFSDWTFDEFKVLLGRKASSSSLRSKEQIVRRPHEAKLYGRHDIEDLATVTSTGVVNWVSKGKTTPVKNQGQCGSCWAFSAAEEVESEWAMNGNTIWEFSPQQIASCTSSCNGCGGGDTPQAYEYIMGTLGLGSSWYAPYVQSMYKSCLGKRCTNACSNYNMTDLSTYASLTGPYAVVSGYQYGTAPCTGLCKGNNQNVTELAANVAVMGPASICVDASSWNDYTGGVLTQAACGGYAAKDLDHCVQLVGYNANAAVPYWLVRNSWATNWGINGYIHLEYPANTCGVANEATYVTISNNQSNFSG